VTDFDDDDIDYFETHDEEPAGPATDVETLLHRVIDIVTNARPMPLSASVMINRDELLEILD
jgi:hypothetical protein